MKKAKLDKYEQEIIDAYEKSEAKASKASKEELARVEGIARNTIKKDKRINIRISSKDLAEIQILAVQEGIPYQTLISSVLHKYVSGRLIDKKKITSASS